MFTNEEFSDVEAIRAAANARLYTNQLYWQITEEYMSNWIALSTNDEVFEFETEDKGGDTWIGSYTTTEYDYLDGFDSTLNNLNGWWNQSYVINQLGWESSTNLPWCGPYAGMIILYYYGYTSHIIGVNGLFNFRGKDGK